MCVCGSSYNQHCSPAFWQAFGADKAGSTSILPLTVVPCVSHSHLTHHPMLCVCVVPATINTALLLFGKPLGLTKPAPHPSLRTCALLSIFVHSFSSLSLSFSICLSYFLLSQSFSLTFSFLNLFLLLSPFSIFLSYFLLFLSFSVYLPKTLSLTI